jgi:hypothetical protein
MSLWKQYIIQEAGRKQKSRHSVTRQTKIKRSQSQLSTSMARKKGDPLYKMMKKYCDRCKDYREKVHTNYASRNRSAARR